MDDVEESEEDIEDDHLEGLKDVSEGETKIYDNLERLIDDKPNLHETSAVEGAPILV